jgi:tetratricopeptide (TPR) repeat protein
MKSGKEEMRQTSAACQTLRRRSQGRTGLAIFLAISLLALSAPFARAASPVQATAPKEAILQEARTLMDRDQANQKNLRQAITTLEAYAAQFPEEIRFPLYLAEAYYRLADPNGDIHQEFPNYEKADLYAQRVLKMDPGRAEGHYWHGLVLLRKAQKRGGVGAYFIVRDGIKELEKVRKTMPRYDHAGASRILGLLYCLAPKWSPFGDLDKSIELGKEAASLAPDYILNRVYLAESYQKRGNKEAAIQEYQAVLALAPNLPPAQAEGFGQKARRELHALGLATTAE